MILEGLVQHPIQGGMDSPVMLGLAVEYLALAGHVAELMPAAVHGGHAEAPRGLHHAADQQPVPGLKDVEGQRLPCRGSG